MKRVAQRPEPQHCAARSPETARRRRWFWSFPCRREHFTRHTTKAFYRHYQGVSHAIWPKDNYEGTPPPTGSAIFCRPEAVDIECRPLRAEGLAKRAKKL